MDADDYKPEYGSGGWFTEDEWAERLATVRAEREGGGDSRDDVAAEAAGAVIATPAWRDASPEEREAARERWLGDEVDDAVDAVDCRDMSDQAYASWDNEDRSDDRSHVREL